MEPVLEVDLAKVAQELKLRTEQVAGTVALLDEGNTVPFITRYRKEQTGNLDEEQIRQIQARVESLRQLNDRANHLAVDRIARKADGSTAGGHSTRRILSKSSKICICPSAPNAVRGRPRPKNAAWNPWPIRFGAGWPGIASLEAAAKEHINPENELPTAAEVLQGVSDILAERMSENAKARELARRVAQQTGQLAVSATKKGEETGQDFRDYFDHEEAIAKIPPHRVLAINRGESAEDAAGEISLRWRAGAGES